ncbi:hypothetical protein AXK12_04585 [Cephaloticoccus capnophilus]|uniref:Uncharacterized protein n=1 Tax=Cephaloticoccus capnophilus TaxID=1548208 RepID=A0A139SMY7_9BACT|nr:hypothetical protein [Cephaloticoccus capnophilus]KXU35963.1 hypothetical protein AXK12_04585 [Cephaloticoccus capnophilus]
MKNENLAPTPTRANARTQKKEACDLDLHFINALFAHLTGHDLYLAAQIKDAIRFNLEELEAKFNDDAAAPALGDGSAETSAKALAAKPALCTPSGAAPSHKGACASFYQAATRLLKTTLGQHFPQRGFYHWDAAQTLASATPLFARDEILNGLKTLAPYRDSTLLITNLRPALLAPPPRRRGFRARRRPSPKRLRDYEELIDFIRHLSAAHTAPDKRLQILFL